MLEHPSTRESVVSPSMHEEGPITDTGNDFVHIGPAISLEK